MINIELFYDIIKNKKSKILQLNNSVYSIVANYTSSSLFELHESNFIKKLYNNKISLNSINYNTLKVNSGKTLYVSDNGEEFSANRTIDELSFYDDSNEPLGIIKSTEDLSESSTTLNGIQNISNKLIYTNIDVDKIELSKISAINFLEYNASESIGVLRIKKLNMANTKYDSTSGKFSYFNDESNNKMHLFGLTFDEDDKTSVRKNDNSNIVVIKEENKFNLYIHSTNEGVIEGKIGKNILLFGDAKNNTIEYWETTENDGIHFRYNKDDEIISISCNNLFESTEMEDLNGNN